MLVFGITQLTHLMDPQKFEQKNRLLPYELATDPSVPSPCCLLFVVSSSSSPHWTATATVQMIMIIIRIITIRWIVHYVTHKNI